VTGKQSDIFYTHAKMVDRRSLMIWRAIDRANFSTER